MENLSLYDILVGGFMSQGDDPLEGLNKLERLPEDEKLRQSIAENLTMVLQTRCGSVLHLPDFGIPDILHDYFQAGGTIEPFKKHIKETILKYEPRIGDVRVETKEFDQNNMRLALRITAVIKEVRQREILLTEFSTTSWTKVLIDRDMK
ncbi:MAG: type VI secretion system baseplate subunit TssE [bacterium]